jgi:hypothetical protein
MAVCSWQYYKGTAAAAAVLPSACASDWKIRMGVASWAKTISHIVKRTDALSTDDPKKRKALSY